MEKEAQFVALVASRFLIRCHEIKRKDKKRLLTHLYRDENAFDVIEWALRGADFIPEDMSVDQAADELLQFALKKDLHTGPYLPYWISADRDASPSRMSRAAAFLVLINTQLYCRALMGRSKKGRLGLEVVASKAIAVANLIPSQLSAREAAYKFTRFNLDGQGEEPAWTALGAK